MVDPEEVRDRRRAAVAEREAKPASTEAYRTTAMLAAERADDPTARGRLWLARWRGDGHALEQIATDEGLDLEGIRAGIDAALRAEGSSLAGVEAARCRPPVRLGRGAVRTASDGGGRQ